MTNKSEQLFSQALKVLPGGVSRNTIFRKPYPFYADKGEGCYVTDVEGVTRIDFANNMASLIHGHAYPAIVNAVSAQLAKGSCFTMATEVEINYAQLLCDRVPSFDKIRFVNSGTEAVMAMLKAARAYTGKAKIAKVEGAYHGAYDYAEVSQTANPSNWGELEKPNSTPVAVGTPPKALEDVVVIPFNDPERAIKILDQYKDEIACVLVDLLPHRVGLIPASNAFINALHKWTRDNKSLLVFDEVITFRTNYRGAQQNYDVSPDLTALGKVIGGGFPVGALAGCDAVMKVLDPTEPKVLLPHSGTFSANPITMTAGLTAMKDFDQAAVTKLNDLAIHAKAEINKAIKEVGISACVTGAGSMFRIHLKPTPPKNYREAYVDKKESQLITKLLDHLFDNGIMMINTCSATLSTAMGKKEIDHLVSALKDGFELLKSEMTL
ncbi:aspartate aminotransferase family protein [Colwellia sp. 12G3]|uniref:aspartate aminotransferase family protein n=1 Tax=Colwellia sp. 12G3 TaxID=2058299 RepID=UPI000C346564|nr:aspartate aminotransferase family protein [Colwellia sp. 12G3]PKI16967.1 aspartate aminotransferase family protein [Colwellia sp. 12G3]